MSQPQHAHSDRKLYLDVVKSMMIDYVVNDLTFVKIAEKYNLSAGTVHKIAQQHQFKEKRIQYQDKLLNKSIDKLASRQAGIYSKITTILQRQVDRIDTLQKKDSTRIIDSARMKEILTAFSLLSKEYRLDNDKSTDNQNITIKVEMGSDVPIISENHIINEAPQTFDMTPSNEEIPEAELKEIESVIKTKEEVKAEPEEESTDIPFGSVL